MDWEKKTMVLWPMVTLLGFLVITGLVIVLGMHSTARYEQERRAAAQAGASAQLALQRTPQRARHAAGEALGAAAVL